MTLPSCVPAILENKGKKFQIILPSDVIIALRLFVFDSARSKVITRSRKKRNSALCLTASAKGGRQEK